MLYFKSASRPMSPDGLVQVGIATLQEVVVILVHQTKAHQPDDDALRSRCKFRDGAKASEDNLHQNHPQHRGIARIVEVFKDKASWWPGNCASQPRYHFLFLLG